MAYIGPMEIMAENGQKLLRKTHQLPTTRLVDFHVQVNKVIKGKNYAPYSNEGPKIHAYRMRKKLLLIKI